MKPHHHKLHDQSAARQGNSPVGASFIHRLLPPGDWLSMLMQVVTFGLVRPCAGCKSRVAAMNRAGWCGLPILFLSALAQWFTHLVQRVMSWRGRA
ncbi:MAG: hypothetical protein CMJ19_16040 [Phycisphaeraceae bacterium]|nr:hypothetical protein [Phycisphaeraceae bacterium]|tara:strand:+ start:176 stop:463 length:288 start_codon:yes stop_codon:yes gene_type:complete